MKVTRASDYAIRALIHMAHKPAGTTFMRSELAQECEIPDSFLGKILQNLAKSEILSSERGKKGGFKVAQKISDISVYDIITAIEGDISLNKCIFDEDFCSLVHSCTAHNMWTDIQEGLIEMLKSYTLAKLTEKY
ncbi:MAG: Rrf2 family transcriptional regulator [Denitrovibrio sp.]|nr:MAG: Rrf2 family transcriptional regulator [Denitrovibrio sp.]